MNPCQRNQDQARQAVERAQALIAQPATLDSYDWGLVASLIVEAHEALRRAQEHDPSATLPLLDEVIEEFRDITSNFTKPVFIAATKSARHQKPTLLASRR